MAINVALVDENGNVQKQLGFPVSLTVSRRLPGYDAADFPYLRFIDPYGDTVSNRVQMIPFLTEWRRLITLRATEGVSEEEEQNLREVEDLALECSRGIHLYLKFIGD